MKKQEKKFVLAALALLAITGLLALAGCKNDTVPEPTRYTVKFETDHGTAPADITVVSGTKLTDKDLAIEPEVGDNIFEYWYGKDDDAQKPVEEGYTVTKDVTLVAKWRDRGTVASVTFTPPTDTKFYLDESIEVSLTSEDGATIQYKLGDQNWQDYTADTTISITGDTTITAKATKEGLKPSDEITATYTVRKLEGITVTTLPAQTVYSERQSFDPTGMVVTATYDDKSQREVTGWETDFNTVAGEKGLNKPVTVSYTEGETPKTTTFTVTVFPAEVKVLTGYTSPNNTDDSWTYVEFGKWPQSEAPGVNPTQATPQSENLFKDKYYFDANGEYVKEGDNYYKVEPIVWRVLTTSYEAPEGGTVGEILLLAEKILTGGIKWADSSNDYMQSYIRKWLNGNSGTEKTSDYNGDAGFLQTAFTESAQNLIADTTVDNSAASTTDAGNNLTQADGCSDTTDKIFLLSEEEATTSEYGFAEYNVYVGDNDGTTTSTRIRVTTDYAKATGAYQGDPSKGYGGWWWLRSPIYGYAYELLARVIYDYGRADIDDYVFNSYGGVVPALSISLGGN